MRMLETVEAMLKIRHSGFGALRVKREHEDKKRGNRRRHGYRLSSNWSVMGNVRFTSKKERDVRSTFLD